MGFISNENRVYGEITYMGRPSVKTVFHEFLDCRLEVDNHLTGCDTMYTARVNRLNGRLLRHPDSSGKVQVAVAKY